MFAVHLTKENSMKPEVNAVLQEVKQSLANPQPTAKPTTPDFSTMSIMESTKWCMENGIDKPQAITNLTGKTSQSVYTALWKLRNPKRVKVLARRAKKAKAIKAGKTPTPKTKTIKVTKPKITNGRYDDGMETPWRDAVMRRGGNFDFLQKQPEESGVVHYLKGEVDRLRKEVQRLTIIVEYYEGKAGK